MHLSSLEFGSIYHLLSSNLGGLGFGKQINWPPSGPQNPVAGQGKHEQTGDKGRDGQQLNRNGPVGADRVKFTTYEDRSSCGSDGICGPGESVEGGKALETEIATQQVRRDVTLASHAESYKCGSDEARGQTVGNRKQHNAEHRHQQHHLANAWAKEAGEKETRKKASNQPCGSNDGDGPGRAGSRHSAIGKQRGEMRDGSIHADSVETNGGGENPKGRCRKRLDNGFTKFRGDILILLSYRPFPDEDCGERKSTCKREQTEGEVGAAPSQVRDDSLNKDGKQHGSQASAGKHD